MTVTETQESQTVSRAWSSQGRSQLTLCYAARKSPRERLLCLFHQLERDAGPLSESVASLSAAASLSGPVPNKYVRDGSLQGLASFGSFEAVFQQENSSWQRNRRRNACIDVALPEETYNDYCELSAIIWCFVRGPFTSSLDKQQYTSAIHSTLLGNYVFRGRSDLPLPLQ